MGREAATVSWPAIKLIVPQPYAHVTVMAHGRPDPLQRSVCQAFEDAMAERSRLTSEAFHIRGFSGRKFRMFLNNLVGAVPNARYLEIGIFAGSTFCSAISGNDVTAVGIDNWTAYGNRSEPFFQTLSKFQSESTRVQILERDFRAVDYASLGSFNILFYDGSDDEKSQYDGVLLPQPALDDTAILIVDDWNWHAVRRGTYDALREAKVDINWFVELRTTLNNTEPLAWGPDSEWHNGFFAAVVHKVVPGPD